MSSFAKMLENKINGEIHRNTWRRVVSVVPMVFVTMVFKTPVEQHERRKPLGIALKARNGYQKNVAPHSDTLHRSQHCFEGTLMKHWLKHLSLAKGSPLCLLCGLPSKQPASHCSHTWPPWSYDRSPRSGWPLGGQLPRFNEKSLAM